MAINTDGIVWSKINSDGEDHLRHHHALRVPGAGARLDDR